MELPYDVIDTEFDLRRLVKSNRSWARFQKLPAHNQRLYAWNPSFARIGDAVYCLMRLSNHNNCDHHWTPIPHPWVNRFSIKWWDARAPHVTQKEVLLDHHIGSSNEDCRVVALDESPHIVCDPAVLYAFSPQKGKATMLYAHPGFKKNVNVLQHGGEVVWFKWPVFSSSRSREREVYTQLQLNHSLRPLNKSVNASVVHLRHEYRGGGCCAMLPGKRLVGIGHIKPVHYYEHVAYELDEGFNVVSVSRPFSLRVSHRSYEWRKLKNSYVYGFPYIQMVMSVSNWNTTHAVIGMGANDCTSLMMFASHADLEHMLRY